MMRALAAAACLLSSISAAPAFAAVQTTGCASSTTCTLAELYAGGSIKVDDVTFSGFAFSQVDGRSIDPATVFLTGESGGATAGLLFGFSPDLVIRNPDFTGYDFDYTAVIDGASARRFISGALAFATADSLAIQGDAFAQVDMGFSSSNVLSIFVDSALGTQSTDARTLANLAALSIAGAFKLDAFEPQAGASIQSFRFTLGLSGVQPEIPLPAAAPLFMAGLAGFAAMRRRKRAAA